MGLKETMGAAQGHPLPCLPSLISPSLISFANEFGLLGLFWEQYPSGPVLPYRKAFIAPEALIDGRSGKLRMLDPATEGSERLLALQNRVDESKGGFFKTTRDMLGTAVNDFVAQPSEVRVYPRVDGRHMLPEGWSEHQPLYWNDIQEMYDVLLVLDGRSSTGVSVLSRSEDIALWGVCLDFFPFPSGEPREHPVASLNGEASIDDSSTAALLTKLRGSLEGTVSPYPMIGKSGRLEPGWKCRNLMSAMYLMLYLDKTGEAEYRKCQAPDCGRLFRARPSSTRLYCPNPEDPSKPSKCGSRVTSRRNRDHLRQQL